MGERVYLLSFHSLAGEERVNIYGFDISDQKELEGKLRENEEKYHKLFEYMQEIFFIADELVPDEAGKPVDYRFAEANQTRESRMRVLPEEITGNMEFEIHPGLDTLWIRNYDRAALTGKYVQSDHHADGQEQHYQVPLHRIKPGRFTTIFQDITDSKQVDSALREDEKPLPFAPEPSHIGVWDLDLVDRTIHRSLEHNRIFGYKQDVKAQWESEMMYCMLFKHCRDAIVLADPRDGGKILSANPAACSMLRWSEEELIGKGLDVMFDPQNPALSTLLAERAHPGSLRAQLIYRRKDGTTFTGEVSIASFTDSNGEPRTVDIIRDITKRKKSEEALANIETVRKQEIHHRIKNNLQVISSLLDLQAEQFKNRECIKNSEVLEAFRESQARVISMALIHEELYKGDGLEMLNFSPYIEELAKSLFHTYRIGNSDIRLKLDLEQNISFDMDTAVPLGIIVNELVSNSLKHAFPDGGTGEITIKLHREENGEQINNPNKNCSVNFILSVSDNGVGIAENLNIEDLDSLGLQLVTTLVEQLNAELELKRNNGTEFILKFIVTEKKSGINTSPAING
ncbi:sensor histidine kinase [Methanosarcina acetivorans]|uniref:Sensory transduction histidine kinase n=1 Tax=Methanosarcina acetivorans (strain ATCC 35395 / DSM 2834 / JCM 12185 / C2A) TaxID=188937 RepID=Q8TMA7_METAC|nr:sensory transduction histidine kinase [Methanosarcina acetivorans C2A]